MSSHSSASSLLARQFSQRACPVSPRPEWECTRLPWWCHYFKWSCWQANAMPAWLAGCPSVIWDRGLLAGLWTGWWTGKRSPTHRGGPVGSPQVWAMHQRADPPGTPESHSLFPWLCSTLGRCAPSSLKRPPRSPVVRSPSLVSFSGRHQPALPGLLCCYWFGVVPFQSSQEAKCEQQVAIRREKLFILSLFFSHIMSASTFRKTSSCERLSENNV